MFTKSLALLALLVGCNAQVATAEEVSPAPEEPVTVTEYRHGECVRVYRSDPRLWFTLSGVEYIHVGCLAFVASGDDAIDTVGATVLVSRDYDVCTCSAE